jgi:hypothetical protein
LDDKMDADLLDPCGYGGYRRYSVLNRGSFEELYSGSRLGRNWMRREKERRAGGARFEPKFVERRWGAGSGEAGRRRFGGGEVNMWGAGSGEFARRRKREVGVLVSDSGSAEGLVVGGGIAGGLDYGIGGRVSSKQTKKIRCEPQQIETRSVLVVFRFVS